MEMTFLVCNSALRPPHVSAGARSRYDLNRNGLSAGCTQAGDHVVRYVVTQSGNARERRARSSPLSSGLVGRGGDTPGVTCSPTGERPGLICQSDCRRT